MGQKVKNQEFSGSFSCIARVRRTRLFLRHDNLVGYPFITHDGSLDYPVFGKPFLVTRTSTGAASLPRVMLKGYG
ncbi:MAG: hypothetical protein M1369_04145 [Deinococcus sp.]|nr:hypothetical protein [Deinococcus sp.]